MSDVIGDVILLVQGDEGHSIEVVVEDDAGAAVDVSGATQVVLYFKKQGASALTATIVGAFSTDGTDGKVRFTWPAGALADDGKYEGEIEVQTLTKIQTVYPILKFKVRAQLQV